MKLYKDCMKDIERAFVLGYPHDDRKYNLYIRKAKCQQFLDKDYTQALEEALQVLDLIKINYILNKVYLKYRQLRITTKEKTVPS